MDKLIRFVKTPLYSRHINNRKEETSYYRVTDFEFILKKGSYLDNNIYAFQKYKELVLAYFSNDMFKPYLHNIGYHVMYG